jgi:hypothetical protein
MCELLTVVHKTTAVYHPSANGQAERINRIIKEALIRCLDANPGTGWWEWIGDVAFMLRITVTKAHGHSPYMIVFK